MGEAWRHPGLRVRVWHPGHAPPHMLLEISFEALEEAGDENRHRSGLPWRQLFFPLHFALCLFQFL